MGRNFNGSSDYIEAALGFDYPLTIAFWFKPADLVNSYAMMSCSNDTGADDDRIQINATGAAGDRVALLAAINGGSSATATTAASFTTSWHHACGVCVSATERSVFLDGTSKATNTTSRVMTGLNRLVVGASRSGGSLSGFFSGALAEFATWNAAFPDGDVATLAKGFSPARVRPQNLVFYAPLLRDIQDVRGGRTLTVSGTTVADHPRIYR